VRIVYSPLDALSIARANPGHEVVFFAVGFETTAPANAMVAWRARELGVTNFSLLVSHVTVPPALAAILEAPDCRVQGVLAAGHVCTVMGVDEYTPLARRYRIPIVVTGFEPLDLLEGILMTIEQLESGQHDVANQYARAVKRDGNRSARRIIDEVFEVVDRPWRGIGMIPRSGLALRPTFAAYDAERKFGLFGKSAEEPAECRAGEVLCGKIKPNECDVFGTACTPEHPLGAPMVSSEGACAAYHRYGRRDPATDAVGGRA
jgi:hydrogenase expression/formation protein HypD